MSVDGAAPTLLRADGVVKRFGGVTAVESGSLEVRAGELKGLVGPNGCGKSTLLNVIAGRIAPDAGEVTIGGEPIHFGKFRAVQGQGIVLVPQELALAPEDRVWEACVLGAEPARGGLVDRRAARRRVQAVLDVLEHDLDLDAPTHTLSPVDQRLLTIVRGAARPDVRLLIFDEPTAGLPHHEAVKVLRVLQRLTNEQRSLILVSHHIDEVVAACDSVSVMRDGRTVRELRGADVERDTIVGLLVNGVDVNAGVDRGDASPPADDPVLTMDRVEGRHLRGPSLTVHRGEIVGVVGLLASGADELIAMAIGAEHPTAGAVRVGGGQVAPRDPHRALRAGVGFVSGQRTRMVIDGLTVGEHVALPSLERFATAGIVSGRRERRWAREQIDALDVRGAPGAPMRSLSGGHQQRALFARWLDADVDLLVVDQPTVGVDLVGRAYILRAMRSLADGRALLVAGEPEELVAVCDRVLCLQRGKIVATLTGSDVLERNILSAIT